MMDFAVSLYRRRRHIITGAMLDALDVVAAPISQDLWAIFRYIVGEVAFVTKFT